MEGQSNVTRILRDHHDWMETPNDLSKMLGGAEEHVDIKDIEKVVQRFKEAPIAT